jgi:signal transduction histidine kinase
MTADGTSGGEPAPVTRNVWERWLVVWHGLFYGLLALTTALVLAEPGLPRSSRLASAGLALGLAAWHWATVARRPERVQSARPMLIFLVGASAFFVALTSLHPGYMFLSFALYSQIFALLPTRWAVGASLAFSVLMWERTTRLAGAPLQPTVPAVLGFALAAGFGVALSLFIDHIIEQSEGRRRLVEELRVTRAALAAEERRAGVREERERLAREIHDTLAQGFAGIVTHLEAAEAALPPGAERARRHLGWAREGARESLSEARRFVRALGPGRLESGSLPDALAMLVLEWGERTGVRADFTLTGDPAALHPETETTLLRAAQEALENVRKHARASRVGLTLSYSGDEVWLDARDDGAGCEPALAPREHDGGGFGLRALRERAVLLGGSVSVESAAGEGTVLSVRLPATADAALPAGRGA